MVLARTPPLSEPIRVGDANAFRDAVAERRRSGQLRRLRRPPKSHVPRLLEVAYNRKLDDAIGVLVHSIEQDILPHLPAIIASAPHELRGDAAELAVRFDEFESSLARTVNGVKLKFLTRIRPQVLAAARQTALAVGEAQKRDHQRTFEAVLGVRPDLREPWLGAVIDNFVAANLRLVDNLSTTVLDRVAQRIGDGVRQGFRAEQIAEQIKGDVALGGGSITSARAELIAQDQVGSLYGDLARVRQQRLGIKRYIWRTSMDERVRPSHEEREGEVFTYGPIEPQLAEKGLTIDKIDGHPGKPIRCRCTAEPVLDDVLGEVDAEGGGDEEAGAPPADDGGGDQEEAAPPEPDRVQEEVPNPIAPTIAEPAPIAPEPAVPQLPASPIERAFTVGKLVKKERLGASGANESLKVTYHDPVTGKMEVGVWKPAAGEVTLRGSVPVGTYYKREAATYELDRLMGGDTVVPPTFTRNDADGDASVQAFAPGARELAAMHGSPGFDATDLAGTEGARRMFALDVITAHSDRHDGNVMVRPAAGGAHEVVAIDNGLTFPTKPVDIMFRMNRDLIDPALDGELDTRTAETVRRLDIGVVAEMLAAKGIEEPAATAAIVRIRALQRDPAVIAKTSGVDVARRASSFISDSFNKPGRGSILSPEDDADVRKAIAQAYNAGKGT